MSSKLIYIPGRWFFVRAFHDATRRDTDWSGTRRETDSNDVAPLVLSCRGSSRTLGTPPFLPFYNHKYYLFFNRHGYLNSDRL
jgi:hypothetical protein